MFLWSSLTPCPYPKLESYYFLPSFSLFIDPIILLLDPKLDSYLYVHWFHPPLSSLPCIPHFWIQRPIILSQRLVFHCHFLGWPTVVGSENPWPGAFGEFSKPWKIRYLSVVAHSRLIFLHFCLASKTVFLCFKALGIEFLFLLN